MDLDGPSSADAAAMLKQRYASTAFAQTTRGPVSHDSQLHQLSAVAAAQDRLHTEPQEQSRKRMADGEVKDHHDRGSGSTSPVKGHGRTTSTVSVASTSGSTISDLSAELKTRLSYAMVKVNHGWQSRSLDEVESLASQGASPTSSTSTVVHRRTGSSASPRLPVNNVSPSPAYPAHTHKPARLRRNSDSQPSSSLSLSNRNRPTLAPPATIRPCLPAAPPRPGRRRNSNPRYTPTMLSHSHSASTSTHSTPVSNGHSRGSSSHATSSALEAILRSPHKNVREQDAIETLLFMSSPGNSANLKRSFSPSASASPGPTPHQGQHQHSSGSRQAQGVPSSAPPPPSSSRRGLPSTRPPAPPSGVSLPAKRGVEISPGMGPPPPSPMQTDAPRRQRPQQQYQQHTPNGAAAAKRHAPSQGRSGLSLPGGLDVGGGTTRKVLRDEDIERMLDRAEDELGDSSDEEGIQLPGGRSGLARVTGS